MEPSDSTKKRGSGHNDEDALVDGRSTPGTNTMVIKPVVGIPMIFDDENSDNDIDILAAPPTKRTWSSFATSKQDESSTTTAATTTTTTTSKAAEKQNKSTQTRGGLVAPFYSVMGDYHDSSTSSSTSGLQFSHTVIARMHIPFPTQLPEFIHIINNINEAMIHKQDWDISITCTLNKNDPKKGFLIFTQGDKTLSNVVFEGDFPVRYEDVITSWNNDAPPTILVPGKRFFDEFVACCKSPNAKFNFGFCAVFTETGIHFKLPPITAAKVSSSSAASASSDTNDLTMSFKFGNKFSLTRSIQQTAIGDHNIEAENPVHPFHCDILRFVDSDSPDGMISEGKSQRIQILPQTRLGLLSLVSGRKLKKSSKDAESTIGKNDKVDVIVIHSIQNVLESSNSDSTSSSSSTSWNDKVICKQDLYLSCERSGASTYRQTSFIPRYSSSASHNNLEGEHEISEWNHVKEAMDWEEEADNHHFHHSKSKQGRRGNTQRRQLKDLTYPTVSLSRLVSILGPAEDATRVEFIIPRSGNNVTMLFIKMTHDMVAPMNDVDDSSAYDSNNGFGKNRQSDQMFATGDTWNITCGLSCDDPCGDEDGDHDSKVARAKADVMKLDSLMPSSTLNARGELPPAGNAPKTFDI